jgi:predicted component of type VI protein secretion system
MTSPTSSIAFDARTRVPEGVLFRELEAESVILSLDSETYFGLDEVGTRFWTVLTAAPSIQAAFETLCGEYDVAPEQLRRDLEELLGELVARKLLEIHGP